MFPCRDVPEILSPPHDSLQSHRFSSGRNLWLQMHNGVGTDFHFQRRYAFAGIGAEENMQLLTQAHILLELEIQTSAAKPTRPRKKFRLRQCSTTANKNNRMTTTPTPPPAAGRRQRQLTTMTRIAMQVAPVIEMPTSELVGQVDGGLGLWSNFCPQFCGFSSWLCIGEDLRKALRKNTSVSLLLRPRHLIESAPSKLLCGSSSSLGPPFLIKTLLIAGSCRRTE